VAILIQGAALLLEHVVKRGHGEVVVGVEALFAACVELRPEVADRGLLRLCGRREGEGIKRLGIVVARIISDTECHLLPKSPGHVDSAR